MKVTVVCVEAADDAHVVGQIALALELPRLTEAPKQLDGNDSKKLENALRQEFDRFVLVLDADRGRGGGSRGTYDRVRAAVRNALAEDLPPTLPQAGLVHRLSSGQILALWVVPDNVADGSMEDLLLSSVVPTDDPLSRHAHVVVATLLANAEVGSEPAARFVPSATSKAHLRSWLAWQNRPGLPPGRAIAEGVLPVDRSRLGSFADWLTAALS